MIEPEEGRKYDNIKAVQKSRFGCFASFRARKKNALGACIEAHNAQPCAMSSTKPLIIVANAFERERKLALQTPARIMWTRGELNDLLGCYGRHVAAGTWRDYAIDDGPEHASFSVFRHSSEASGGYFPSTIHRVINPTGKASDKSRISLPLFLHPRPDVVLSERYTADEYLNERLRELGVK